MENIYGISQNLDTKDYIMVLKNQYCKKCGEKYTDIQKKWCKSCYIKNASKSKNEKINGLIQEMQLKMSDCKCSILFEWIPYDQFNNISEISKDNFAILYLATWKNGPLNYNYKNKKSWNRESDKKVILKYLFKTSNAIDELLNKV